MRPPPPSPSQHALTPSPLLPRSFKNAIIILTSNLGSAAILETMGLGMDQQGVKDMVMGYVSVG